MLAAERVKVFWQPGCTSCLRTKEFLTKSGVDYESINVHGNPAGMEELRKLGARSVPIVSRGDKFVFAQTLTDVIKFLDLKVKLQERLSPAELIGKLNIVLPPRRDTSGRSRPSGWKSRSATAIARFASSRTTCSGFPRGSSNRCATAAS